MHHTDYLLQALVYFGAAALFVPVFHKLGLGSVLGYLVAGAAIGPWGVRLVTDPTTVAQVSELGVVLLCSWSGWNSIRSGCGRCAARSSAWARCRSG